MMRETEEFIEEFGKTNDIIMGIIMFWCITSVRSKYTNLEYFNSKMLRYLNYESTEEQMFEYLDKLESSVLDDGNSISDITHLIY